MYTYIVSLNLLWTAFGVVNSSNCRKGESKGNITDE